MFNIGGAELVVIMIVALLVLGPDKLPEAAKKMGAVMKEVRQISTGFRTELREAIDQVTPTELITPPKLTPEEVEERRQRAKERQAAARERRAQAGATGTDQGDDTDGAVPGPSAEAMAADDGATTSATDAAAGDEEPTG